MADIIKKVKVMQPGGTFTNYIPLGADATDVRTEDGMSVENKLKKKPYYFDTVADMKAANYLTDGDMAVTLGYYSINDGGEGEYNIIDDSGYDNNYYEELNNGLLAELIIKDNINIKQLGAYGNGINDDTSFLQNAINFAYIKNFEILVPYGIYKTNSLILKTNIYGINKPIILFNENERFTNYEADGSKRYNIKKIENIIFESDKSSYWNSTDAGASYNQNVTKKDVIRKYGQRVYIGNKTTAPNNIHSTNENETLNGTGNPFNDYNQWVNASSLNLNDIASTFEAITDKSNTNIITNPNGIIINNCHFIGFGIGLTLKATYNSQIINSSFERCKIGMLTISGGTLPGDLQDSNAKITTLKIENNLFSDIKYFGMYNHSLLQSNVTNNIFQPVNLGIVLLNSADNEIKNNYNEIIYAGVLVASNNAYRNNIERNFTNNTYSTYNVYLKYGVKNNFGEPINNIKGYVASSTENNDFDEKFDLTISNAYFYANGNAINRSKTKYAVFNTTGNGTGITTTLVKTNRKHDVLPSITNSQAGLYLNGKEEILSIECLDNGIHTLSYYNVASDGNPKVCYVRKWDSETSSFNQEDLRTNDTTHTFRVTFNDGYKTS